MWCYREKCGENITDEEDEKSISTKTNCPNINDNSEKKKDQLFFLDMLREEKNMGMIERIRNPGRNSVPLVDR